jgi:membrane carboxypeptidase/penicillin-binding protein
MREALKAFGNRPFDVPSGVVFRDVDRHSGLLASVACPESIHEAFIVGTEPSVTCDGRRIEGESHPEERVLNWFEHLFQGR